MYLITGKLFKYLFPKNINPYFLFIIRLSRARRTVESAFGHLANRFRLLRRPMDQQYHNCVKSIQAMVVLHNYIKHRSIEYPKMAEDNKVIGLLPMNRNRNNNASGNRQAKDIREKLANFFFSKEGQVKFQWERTFGANKDLYQNQ